MEMGYAPNRHTLTQFILDEQRAHNNATGEFTSVLNDIALACKKIAWLTSKGALVGVLGSAGSENVQGEEQKKMDIITNDVMLEALSRGHTAVANTLKKWMICILSLKVNHAVITLLHSTL